jgi:hypothetical protein
MPSTPQFILNRLTELRDQAAPWVQWGLGRVKVGVLTTGALA